MKDCNLVKVDMLGAKTTWLRVDRSDLSHAEYDLESIHRGWLTECKVGAVDWSYRDLSGAQLSQIDISGGVLTCSNLTDAVLNNVTTDDTEFYGATFNVEEACSMKWFRNAKVSSKDFPVDWSNKVLQESMLAGCSLKYANLSGVDFTGSDLSRCDFTGASLRDANLSKCRFDHAICRDCDLDGVIYEDMSYGLHIRPPGEINLWKLAAGTQLPARSHWPIEWEPDKHEKHMDKHLKDMSIEDVEKSFKTTILAKLRKRNQERKHQREEAASKLADNQASAELEAEFSDDNANHDYDASITRRQTESPEKEEPPARPTGGFFQTESLEKEEPPARPTGGFFG